MTYLIHLLSGFIREYCERNKNFYHFKCDKNEVESIRNQVPHDNNVLEKVRKLLLAIERRTEYPGYDIPLESDIDYPLAYCKESKEFHYYLLYLKDKELIFGINRAGGWDCHITVPGWQAIESYKVPNAESEKVFVAMWFNKETDDAYKNSIQMAIEEDCGYKPIRIDRKEYLGKVDDEIIAEIRESRFIVADFTGQRNGVYFEAGFAQGLGLPVISSCRADNVKELHFDTRQENHITWETPEELREKLKNRIRAVIGLGPHKSN
ncbi:MAG: hypothetical protein ABSE63_15965 [Thermoguttaceae bacterium]